MLSIECPTRYVTRDMTAITASCTVMRESMIAQVGIGAARRRWKTPRSRSRAMLCEYAISPVAGSPTEMQIASTAAPPISGIRLFQEMMKMSGMMSVIRSARRFLHCTRKSARRRARNTSLTLGMGLMKAFSMVVLSVCICYFLTARPVSPMNTSSSVTTPRRMTATTSGSSL